MILDTCTKDLAQLSVYHGEVCISRQLRFPFTYTANFCSLCCPGFTYLTSFYMYTTISATRNFWKSSGLQVEEMLLKTSAPVRTGLPPQTWIELQKSLFSRNFLICSIMIGAFWMINLLHWKRSDAVQKQSYWINQKQSSSKPYLLYKIICIVASFQKYLDYLKLLTVNRTMA